MIGTLVDVFEISGRGCVVLVDVDSGECRTDEELVIGAARYPITGIDIPRYSLDAVQRMAEGWKPPVGLLLKGADKANLTNFVGQRCSTTAESSE